jgi:polyhydroxyalkanoate synthesis regulator phasin
MTPYFKMDGFGGVPVKEAAMLDLFKKTMLTGIGLALLAKDEVEDLAKDLIDKGKMSEQDGRKFFNELQERYDKVQAKLEEQVEKTVKEMLKKADIVTGDDLKALKKEIRDLKKAVAKSADESG